MKSPFIFLSAVCVAISAPTHAAEFKFGEQTLTVPEGFEIELIAGTNLVERPVSVDFDEQGRLYATDSSGSNDKVAEQLEKKPHRVVRLEDSDGDGHFDKSVVFADKMMFPEGCMYFDGSVYVSAPPSIWKLTDTNSDGIADIREEWHQGKTLTGCANDLHGPYLGPDGWIYWCKGAFAEQTYEVNGKPFITKASHIFRARPDHSRMEPVMTGGMDNPVGITFSPTGERFLAGTFFEPHIPGRRDGVIHAIYGGVYGKPHPDVLDGFAKTGDLMPVMIHLGPAASCSVIWYRSGEIGTEFRDNLFVCNFNLHNVTRHILTPEGATYKSEDSVFLSSDSPDFHPTCILEDADGSLIVVDTGGWYKICCPTSQLYKPDMLGAIYRIKKKDAHKIEDPRGLKVKWEYLSQPTFAEALTTFLDDAKRPYVVTRAIHQLAKNGNASVPALVDVLKNSKSANARRNAVWALTQIESEKAREATRPALNDKEQSVRLAALHSVSLWRDKNAFSSGAFSSLTEKAPLRRATAEALGRISASSFHKGLSSILLRTSLEDQSDRILEHSLAYALIELDQPDLLTDALSGSVLSQRVALIALDQMDHGNLKVEQVAPFLLSTNAELKQTASWIVSHHPEWGTVLAQTFKQALAKQVLAKNESSEAQKAELQSQLARLASNTAIQELLTATMREEIKAFRLIALRAISQSGVRSAPAGWSAGLVPLLADPDPEIVREAVSTAHALTAANRPADLNEALRKIAKDNAVPVETRVLALASLPDHFTLEPELFHFLQENIQPDKAVSLRGNAATALLNATLNDEQLFALTENLKVTGPMETTRLLGAFDISTNEALGLKLISALRESKAISSLRAENVRPKFARFPAFVQQELEKFLASLNVDSEKQKAHIDELIASLKDGDIRRGQAVFNSSKAACSSCHAIGYGGGHVGPDLTKIGTVRTERDLIEAVVYPSASFVRSFEPVVVITKSGDDYSGIVKKDAPDEVALTTGPNAEIKIARADISEMRPGTVSIMPQGLDEQLSKQELADLIAFLKATRW